ncbi:hypothetical protein F441_19341 [Phytophthora nicotianae CJ01A1]|uniref:Retrotransposon gag domain-containing protein n=1 Tax=Phytophthora nicotianae CJ01A1 TaxID=1317063 RepID=W2W024_PHYNI|nr:hypothetical protein F441_19341 [Phytophthora nicotianae CJ01A1]
MKTLNFGYCPGTILRRLSPPDDGGVTPICHDDIMSSGDDANELVPPIFDQTTSLHDYVAEFQNLLIQCAVPISQLELRFYFQQGLTPATANHLREHHPAALDETI